LQPLLLVTIPDILGFKKMKQDQFTSLSFLERIFNRYIPQQLPLYASLRVIILLPSQAHHFPYRIPFPKSPSLATNATHIAGSPINFAREDTGQHKSAAICTSHKLQLAIVHSQYFIGEKSLNPAILKQRG